jgi:hypothetical protein
MNSSRRSTPASNTAWNGEKRTLASAWNWRQASGDQNRFCRLPSPFPCPAITAVRWLIALRQGSPANALGLPAMPSPCLAISVRPRPPSLCHSVLTARTPAPPAVGFASSTSIPSCASKVRPLRSLSEYRFKSVGRSAGQSKLPRGLGRSEKSPEFALSAQPGARWGGLRRGAGLPWAPAFSADSIQALPVGEREDFVKD